MIAKNLVVKIQTLALNRESQPIKLNPDLKLSIMPSNCYRKTI